MEQRSVMGRVEEFNISNETKSTCSFASESAILLGIYLFLNISIEYLEALNLNKNIFVLDKNFEIIYCT